MVGKALSHYKILEKIGSGGMGDVYLAEDTNLKRKIALKLLPPELAEDEERRARFQREAQAIAALNHPNIVHVYSVEEADGIHFMTMELVEGETLAELVPKKGFTQEEFFNVAIPLANAVAAAHDEGITHRDLKPANVMVTGDGHVKVLDFGLARAAAGGLTVESEAPTALKTGEGTIVGTVAYMSPEQAQGKAVDHRSDIFSLGVVFYEMLTGRRPFVGDTPAEILSSIIKDAPPEIAATHSTFPHELSRTIAHCLAKKPETRLQSCVDLRLLLDDSRVGVSRPSRERAHRFQTPLPSWLVGIAALAGLTGWSLAQWMHPSPPSVPHLTNPRLITSALGVEDYPAWSPDGQMLAYASAARSRTSGGSAGNWDIWVTPVASGRAINRTADYPGDDRCPSWSPNGGDIAFWSDRDGGGYYIMSALGGGARRVMSSGDSVPSYPQWSRNGRELAGVVREGSVVYAQIHDLQSGTSRKIDLPGSSTNRFDLSWSQDGRFLAYVDTFDMDSSLTSLWILRIEDQKAFQITSRSSKDESPSFSPDGRLLYFLSDRGVARDLWQLPLDDSGRPSGEPRAITTGLVMRRAIFSSDGSKLAYSSGRPISNLWRVPILSDRRASWSDAEQLTFDQARIEMVDVSPNGRTLLFSSDRGGNYDLWSMSIEDRELEQFIVHPHQDWNPKWSPDGTEVAFYSGRSGNRDIWVQPAAGGAPRQLTFDESDDLIPAWSPDGREIAFQSVRDGNADIYVVPSDGGDVRRITTDPATDDSPLWTRDGSAIFFTSNRTGDYRLWQVPASGGPAELVSQGIAHTAIWSRDRPGLFFTSAQERQGNLWQLSLTDGLERPVTDFEDRIGTIAQYALSTDGDYLYFAWEESLGDIWVMDMVTDP